MVPSTIEMETGNIMLGTWTRYFLSLTMLPNQIKVNWRVRPISKDPDQEGKEEIFKSPQEYMDWNNFLEENQWKIYPLLANILKVFLPGKDYQILYTLYPQGFISIIAKPIKS